MTFEHSPSEREAVVLVIDLVDSVDIIQRAEAWSVEIYRRFVDAFLNSEIPAEGARMVKSTGDGLMIECTDPLSAIRLGRKAHERLAAIQSQIQRPQHVPPLQFRAGIHRSHIVADAIDIYGAGVNLAARLASIASPGDIFISGSVREQVVNGVDGDLEDLGAVYLKGYHDPVPCFRVQAVVSGPAEVRRADAHGGLNPVIAVLHLEPLGVDPLFLILGDLITEAIICGLSKAPGIKVISRLSSKALQGRRLGLPEVAASLRSDYVVSGTFRIDREEVLLTLEMAQAPDATVLDSHEHRVDVRDVLRRDASFGLAIAQTILMTIRRSASQAALFAPLPTLPSCTLLMAAISAMHSARDIRLFDRSARMLEQLIQRHPRHPEPYAWLAKWSVMRAVQGISPSSGLDVDNAYRASASALHLAPDSSLALTMAGLVHAYLRHDFVEAEHAYDLALQANPNESMALLLKGTMHAFRAEGTQAATLTELSLELSPLDPLRYFYEALSASAAIANQDYERAVALATSSLRLNRSHASTWRSLALATSLLGRTDQAQQAIDGLLRIEPSFTVADFRRRFPGRDEVPQYLNMLCEALQRAGLPAGH